MNRSTITAAIIARNEERHLAELLPRLAWTDEIVLVDGHSRDGTVAVARRHGCRVLKRALDDFAAQRNYAAAASRGDWILSIDADERPAPGLVREIRRRAGRGPQVAFRVPIRSWIFGRRVRRCGTQDDLPVRLFRRGCAAWEGGVHERLRARGPVGRMRHWLEHHTLPDLHAFLVKMHRYTHLEARSRLVRNQAPRACDPWLAPAREAARRLLWKQGILDGPHGWAFCLLSGLSEWVLAREHRRLWNEVRPMETC